ncbi:MAG TPA: hypothetical protein VD865_18185 [Stenotrophomonas sp.]|nr:hypothetical protein [Stenotrophomonas sp.]
MRLSALLPMLLSTVVTLPALAQGAPRYLDLVNHAHNSVVSLQVAAHGQVNYAPVSLDGALRGGGDSQTIALRGEACRYDLRFDFADGRALRYEDVDVCRYGKLRIRPFPPGVQDREYVVRAK